MKDLQHATKINLLKEFVLHLIVIPRGESYAQAQQIIPRGESDAQAHQIIPRGESDAQAHQIIQRG